MSEKHIELSFIIPTLNESENIGETISSIREFLSGISHEIIVVDNGSVDQTVELSTQLADKVKVDENATIGGLRNIGAEESRGDVLVFNDADVLLTSEWRREYDSLKSHLINHRVIIGGSLDSSAKNNMLFQGWFRPVLAKKSNEKIDYVGTGHMLLSKKVFFECGGFNPNLISGEDYEFCRRATKASIKVNYNPNLRTIHLGYPLRLKEFFIREMWHGRGDFQSFKDFSHSKVAIFALSMLLMHVVLFGIIIANNLDHISFFLIITSLFPISFSLMKFPVKLGAKTRLANFLFSYVYLLARSLSWVRISTA